MPAARSPAPLRVPATEADALALLRLQLAALPWAQPWFAGCREHGQRVARRVLNGLSVAEALNAEIEWAALATPEREGAEGVDGAVAPTAPPRLAAGPLRFVSQQALPPGEAYEAFIARTACVPTRDNLHDFFNGLVWCTQPVLKRRLNELQAAQIAASGVGTTRGPVRDALTLFDENAALLHAPAELIEALRQRQWQRLFLALREHWQQARLDLVGHALLEKLVTPRKAITAHVFVTAPGFDPAGLDEATLATKPYLPLPVLGVPGWWAANEAPGFYDDVQVFRPASSTASRQGR